MLTLEEFLASRPDADRADGQRRFLVFDFDASGKLDEQEFHDLTCSTDERGAVPDPILEIEQAALAKWETIFAAADGNRDAALSPEEWPARPIEQELPALAGVSLWLWDRDGDGKVGRAEGHWLLEVAFGLTQLDGRPLRTSTGRVFSWYYFRALDANNDGVLSRPEFVSGHHEGREKSAAIFADLDTDGDGRLTAEETATLLWHDTIGWFFAFDGNRDGYVSGEEFLGVGWGKSLAARTVGAFDADGDGQISFREFRGTTFANQASDWTRMRRDADNDGRLSFAEFYLEKPPLLVAQCRHVFDHFDLDRDGFLSLQEFDFEADFFNGDVDRDGRLTLDEFLASRPDADRADGRRRFLVFDFDGSGKLDKHEFHDLSCSADERGPVPDPMAEFAAAALAKWKSICATADRDGDGALSHAEWPAKEIASEVPALADVPFDLWDRGGDGQVDATDARRLCDVAYGLAQLDDRPLRTPSGRMFAWYFFRRHDADGNDRLSAKEFVEGYHPPNVNTAELFEKLDADGDAELTQQETWSVFCHDTIAMFLDYDRDQDGYLTADEVRAIGWGRYLARRTVPVFDDDGDGKLSFREFRLTTFANQASDWWQLKDLDQDGRLSWQEFYREKPPLLIAQSRFYFDRFDRDKDGLLSPVEFASEAEPTHARILANADMFERVLPLELQFATRVCQLTDNQIAALEQDGHTAVERLAETLAMTARKNKNQASGYPAAMPLTVADLAMLRSPHLLLRREMVQALHGRVEKLATAPGDSELPDLWRKLDVERGRAEKRRQQADILEYVAALDETLLLSERQRDELCAWLANDAWRQPANAAMIVNPDLQRLFAQLSSGGFQGLNVPEAALAEKLTAAQLATFKQLQQPQDWERFYVQQAVGKQRRFLRQVPTAECQERRLAGYVQLRLDDVDSACGLSQAVRAKLSLAAKLDLARLREQLSSRPADTLNDGEELVVQKLQFSGLTPLTLEVLNGPESHFQKALQGRLVDEQKDKLAAADARRRAFQREALVEAVVAGFERSAALTSEQCDGLAKLLNETTPDVQAESADDWRFECVRRIAQLPFEPVRTLLFDFQQPLAQQQHARLIEFARQLEAQRTKNVVSPVAAGGGIFGGMH
ncbi:MAG TPA: hypothetical protein VFI31_13325 [Pirellulales bacterium]|nr:hypothetical protein [Pirellulales bacterium]